MRRRLTLVSTMADVKPEDIEQVQDVEEARPAEEEGNEEVGSTANT